MAPGRDLGPLFRLRTKSQGLFLDAHEHRRTSPTSHPERGLTEVEIDPEPLDRFASVLEVDQYDRLLQTAEIGRGLLGKRTIWNVTSTARGGGVAEMLTSLLPLAAGAGALVRWMVIRAEERFFHLTKRIHNRLHGDLGDGSPLGPVEHALYNDVMRDCATELLAHVTSDSIVILHDPQTLGLAPYLRRVGATG